MGSLQIPLWKHHLVCSSTTESILGLEGNTLDSIVSCRPPALQTWGMVLSLASSWTHGWVTHQSNFAMVTGYIEIWLVTGSATWVPSWLDIAGISPLPRLWACTSCGRRSMLLRLVLVEITSPGFPTSDGFTFRSAWEAVHQRNPKVPWASLIWNGGAVPRHAFCT